MKRNREGCVLFFCNTYMQLINAIQIKLKLLQDIEADILLSDHSQNTERVAKALENVKLFRRVRVVRTKYYTYEQNLWEDIKDIITMTVGKGEKYRKLIWERDIKYDAIFYYNLSLLTYLVYDISKKNGVEPECIRYEEGIASYPSMKRVDSGKRIKLVRIIRTVLCKKDVFKSTRYFYCFYPELFHGSPEQICYQIPFLKKQDYQLIELLNNTFGYAPVKFRQKYIYFSTSMDIDGKKIEEDQLVKQLAESLGKDNVIIKVHPRDTRNIYRNMGLEILENSEIPWEIIQLNNEFSDKIFISLSSGSILNASAMLNENIRTYYLFPCIKGKDQAFDEYCLVLGKLVKELQGLGYCTHHEIISQIDKIVEDESR